MKVETTTYSEDFSI